MKVLSRVGLLTALAVLAMAASAQAVTINPDNAAVSGAANNPTLSYGGNLVECATGTADGTTGLDSDRISDLALAFQSPCSVAGILDAVVDCEGDVTLIAENATTDTGTVNLNSGFRCDVTTDLCVITVEGPQTTDSGNVALNETTNVLSADVDVDASRVGNELCGPATGDGNFTAAYATTPTNLTIDP